MAKYDREAIKGSAINDLMTIATGKAPEPAEPKKVAKPKAEPKKVPAADLDKEKKQKKSDSLLLLLYPEQKKKLKALAGYKQVSVNNLLNDLVDALLEEHKAELEALENMQKGK